MTFRDLNLNTALYNALDEMGIVEPTAIQAKTFGSIMAGRDVLGIAQTGTGKTFAYLLPLLRMWKFSKSSYPQILIIVPTRELVVQVKEEIEKLAKYMNLIVVGVYGGTNMRTQKSEVDAGTDIVVGTPGRLIDLMMDGVLKTKKLNKLVIDEVDEMLNLGFRIQLKTLLQFLPEKRQNLMFSATLLEEVEEIIDEYSAYYERLDAAPAGAPLENIEQSAYSVPNFNSKASLLEYLLLSRTEMVRCLVFVSTKKMADALYESFAEILGEEVGVIHSSKSQNNRFDAVNRFQDGSLRVLIATDIIARGLDITMVSHVINFDLPDIAERYIHRIGRTGRAEQKGIAISFVSEKEAEYKVQIEELMQQSIDVIPIPEEVILSDELIDIEREVVFVPFNHHKVKQHEPTGPAFHEKKLKNQKENRTLRRADKMKLKYKKPKTRGQKKKKGT